MDMVDEYKAMVDPGLWKNGYDHGLKESERMICKLQEELRKERELRKEDNERFTNLLYPDGYPSAWKFKIKPYCDHGYCSGVVLKKSDISPYIPQDKITWTPLYEA